MTLGRGGGEQEGAGQVAGQRNVITHHWEGESWVVVLSEPLVDLQKAERIRSWERVNLTCT